jgi:DNA-binding NarL/FixJ family response regulator
VLLVALALLTFSPIEVDYPIKFGQFLLLLIGFVVLVTLDLLLMRRVLAPLFRLTEVMSSIEPDKPGTRLESEDPRSAEGRALANAFNGMLDRLESARREAARTALEAQESERLRVAQELHDEVGQTLTAVTLQAERAAEGDPAEANQALRDFFEALKAGASGYVLKSVANRDLIEACRATMRGEPFLYPAAVRALARDYLERASRGEATPEDPLRPGELEVVKLIAEGLTSEEIGDQLFISRKAVDRHRENVPEKLGMRNRVELTRYAIRRGLITP